MHVIENTLNDDAVQSFNMTLDYTDINGPVKGVFYRHALGKFDLNLEHDSEKLRNDEHCKILEAMVESLQKVTSDLRPTNQLTWRKKIQTLGC